MVDVTLNPKLRPPNVDVDERWSGVGWGLKSRHIASGRARDGGRGTKGGGRGMDHIASDRAMDTGRWMGAVDGRRREWNGKAQSLTAQLRSSSIGDGRGKVEARGEVRTRFRLIAFFDRYSDISHTIYADRAGVAYSSPAISEEDKCLCEIVICEVLMSSGFYIGEHHAIIVCPGKCVTTCVFAPP
jgi:hypothetical protein